MIDRSLIESILENIKPDNEPLNIIGGLVFDKVDVLVSQHFSHDFCQLIVDSIEPTTDLRRIAILFDILIWSTPDNGLKQNRLTKHWFESSSLSKIKSILFRHEWLPSEETWEMESMKILQIDSGLNDLIRYYTEELKYSKKTGLRRIDKLKELINNC